MDKVAPEIGFCKETCCFHMILVWIQIAFLEIMQFSKISYLILLPIDEIFVLVYSGK